MIGKKTFKASRESCILTSYTHLLNKLNGKKCITPNVIFLAYIKYFRELHQNDCISADILVAFGKKLWNLQIYQGDFQKIEKSYIPSYKISNYGTTTRELLSSIMLHYECIEVRKNKVGKGISGYKHLIEFDKRLHNENSNECFGVKSNLSAIKSYTGGRGIIEDVEREEIKQLLEGNSEDKDKRAALILYHVVGGLHSILVYYRDRNYYKIDPNCGIEQPFDWDVKIAEYIIFNIKNS